MINIKLLPKAYTEVLEILKYVNKEDYEKIPRYIIENMEKEKDIEYQYSVTNFIDFNEQEMMKETEVILAVLFRDYWATKEQKMIIRAKEMKSYK
ncbi:MAG: hypothetical protein IJX99_04715 [Clostridia bacterium]|nr:hypothetical protein [Clostridia bacterium]